MFVDEVKVFCRAGHGGKGCVAFLRENSRPKGGPSGGNGGRGGSVILQADHDLNNLIAQFYTPRLIAEPGHPGLGKGMDGPAGKDLIIKVPCGTLVWRLFNPATSQTEQPEDSEGTARRTVLSPDPHHPGDEQEDIQDEYPKSLLASSSQRAFIRHAGAERAIEILPDATPSESHDPQDKTDLVADLTTHGQQFVLCTGGRGGLGNRNFATARRQTPRFAQPGEPGTEGDFLLELRIIADVGLVGYPNAGKSTLLTAISRARPKVAPYPFTTLHPQIGIVEYPDFSRLTVCDVPGLIEGAHRNVGLGHRFLRHIRRCKVLVILLDMAATDGRPPWEDYRQVLAELSIYDPSLLNLPRLIVANKMDEPVAEQNLKAFKQKIRKVSLVPISAAFDQGLPQFRTLIRKSVEAASRA